MTIIHVTDDTVVDTVLKSDKLVLINFFSPLSERCAELLKTLEAFAEKHKDKIDVIRADVDLCPALTEALGVVKIPSVVSIKGDEPLVGMEGVLTADMLQMLVDRSLQILGKRHINSKSHSGPKPPGP